MESMPKSCMYASVAFNSDPTPHTGVTLYSPRSYGKRWYERWYDCVRGFEFGRSNVLAGLCRGSSRAVPGSCEGTERLQIQTERALLAGSVTHPTDCAPTMAQCSSSSAEAPETPMAPMILFDPSRQRTPPGTAQKGWLLLPPMVVIARSWGVRSGTYLHNAIRVC